MYTILKIGFEFRENYYYALIRVKEKDGFKEFQITVMNGKLETLLYGNHIIKEMNGNLLIEDIQENEQGRLKLAIALALSKFLNIPVSNAVLVPEERVS